MAPTQTSVSRRAALQVLGFGFAGTLRGSIDRLAKAPHLRDSKTDNAIAVYAGAGVKGAPHEEAARTWLAFIRSPATLKILEGYGFKPHGANP